MADVLGVLRSELSKLLAPEETVGVRWGGLGQRVVVRYTGPRQAYPVEIAINGAAPLPPMEEMLGQLRNYIPHERTTKSNADIEVGPGWVRVTWYSSHPALDIETSVSMAHQEAEALAEDLKHAAKEAAGMRAKEEAEDRAVFGG